MHPRKIRIIAGPERMKNKRVERDIRCIQYKGAILNQMLSERYTVDLNQSA